MAASYSDSITAPVFFSSCFLAASWLLMYKAGLNYRGKTSGDWGWSPPLVALVAILSVRTGAWSYIPQMRCQSYFNDFHAKSYSHVTTTPPPQCTAFTSRQLGGQTDRQTDRHSQIEQQTNKTSRQSNRPARHRQTDRQ